MNTYLVLKDEEGILRPMAGVWKDDRYGQDDAEKTAKRNNDTVVRVKIEEV